VALTAAYFAIPGSAVARHLARPYPTPAAAANPVNLPDGPDGDDPAAADGCAVSLKYQRLRAAGLVCRLWRPRTPWRFMDGLASVGLVVAMRLHAVILAAMADRPLLALRYDPKVDAAATAMAVPSTNLADPDGSAALPAAWAQARRWRLSPARLAQHRQRDRCHQKLLARCVE